MDTNLAVDLARGGTVIRSLADGDLTETPSGYLDPKWGLRKLARLFKACFASKWNVEILEKCDASCSEMLARSIYGNMLAKGDLLQAIQAVSRSISNNPSEFQGKSKVRKTPDTTGLHPPRVSMLRSNLRLER